MALIIVRGDLTKMKVDAIVNPSNRYLNPGIRDGSVDAQIHELGGPALCEELERIGTCPVGSAVITPSYGIHTCKYIIHCVSPVYYNGHHGESKLLANCYKTVLTLALEKECKSIAFPAIATGTYRYPKAEAYSIATTTIRNFLLASDTDIKVYLVLHNQELAEISEKVDGEINDYIAKTYPNLQKRQATHTKQPEEPAKAKEEYAAQDKPFAYMCEWWMDQKGMPIGEFYSRANILKATFSRLRTNSQIVPKKNTALACAIGLKLDYDQTQDLLKRAGMILTGYYETDVIVEYFIRKKDYDIDVINSELASKNLPTLGASMK